MLPSLTPLFPSAEVARAATNVVCVGPKAAAAGFLRAEPRVHDLSTATMLTDGSGAAASWGRARAGSRWWSPAPNTASCSVPRLSACATMRRSASTATTSRKAGRSRLRSSAPGTEVNAERRRRAPANYFSSLRDVHQFSWRSCCAPVTHSRRAEAARRSARHGLWLTAVIGAAIIGADVCVRRAGDRHDAATRPRACGRSASSPTWARTRMCCGRWPLC